ncbi:beta family protein [Streptomyces sp. NBC_01190]|uniref:beta family protein n=1 Tax=Streptomyces sp. NBC_01190 TaxID=2903767 RepID=UPI00386BFABD|nr:beta family protein [Streptomyces sp. NBC_01190]
MPILKGKLGEFLALGEMAPEVQADVHPVLEVVVDDSRVRDVLETFVKHACRHLPKGLVVGVDCGALWRAGPVGGLWTGHSMNWLSEAFGAWLLPLIPVFRPDDPPGALREIRDVQRAHGRGAVLRLDLFAGPSDPRDLERVVRAALDRLCLPPESVDVVLDAGYVPGDTALTEAVPLLRDTLRWARTRPWRSVVAASGAFPRSIRALPRGHPNLLPRWDAALWRKLAGSIDGEFPEFADYGVSHPVPPVRAGRGAIPHLRYTVADAWLVHVAPGELPGNNDFFTICQSLVHSADWPALGEKLSWGDAEIALCARQGRPKAATATYWRAWATSHHLAVVTKSLRTMGSP